MNATNLALICVVWGIAYGTVDVGKSILFPLVITDRVTYGFHATPDSIVRSAVFERKESNQLFQAPEGRVFEHNLEGEWDQVIAQVGFFHEFDGIGNAFVNIIGLPTERITDDTYETYPWERKAFWITVDDGALIHVGVDFEGEFIDPDTDESVFIYYSQFMFIRLQGKDYSESEFDGEFTYLELITDLDNNVIDNHAYLLDDNREITEEFKYKPGDEILPITVILDMDDPSIAWGTSLEETPRPITTDPEFFYAHLNPNVDFENESTLGVIDFTEIDLHLVLWGNLEDWDNFSFVYSTAKDIETKWFTDPTVGIADWLLSEVE